MPWSVLILLFPRQWVAQKCITRTITSPPKMSLLLEVKSTTALIIKPRLNLFMQMDDLGWYIMSNLWGQMLIQNLNRIVRRPNVIPGQILDCRIQFSRADPQNANSLRDMAKIWSSRSW